MFTCSRDFRARGLFHFRDIRLATVFVCIDMCDFRSVLVIHVSWIRVRRSQRAFHVHVFDLHIGRVNHRKRCSRLCVCSVQGLVSFVP